MKQITILLAAIMLSFTACKKDIQKLDAGYNPEISPSSFNSNTKITKIDLGYNPDISPSNFSNSTNVTNPYSPFTAGKKYIYEGHKKNAVERIVEQRLSATKVIIGINCIVVNFKAYLNGILIESALDWYAQDNSGNLWYFGEAVDNYNEDGTFKDHAGSWEAGVNGAKPGTIMFANPKAPTKYREEYYFDHAEDQAEIIATGVTVTIPLGTYTNCVKTRNFTRLEPDLNELKFYAPGIGLVKEIDLNDNSVTRLIAIQ